MNRQDLWRILFFTTIGFLALYVFAFRWIVRSGADQVSQRFIRDNAAVENMLGQVDQIELSRFANARVVGAAGEAHLKYYVTGPTASGIVFVDLRRSAEVWTVMQAKLALKDRQTIALK